MPGLDALLQRNRHFAETDRRLKVPRPSFLTRERSCIVSCVDPRTDPAAIFELRLGDAIVVRTAGGRVTPSVLRDITFMSYLTETQSPPGPWFEVAVIHHTDCGTRFLAEPAFRQAFAERSGAEPGRLEELAVTEPEQTVRSDVERIVSSGTIAEGVLVSGFVYDVETGLVTAVVRQLGVRAR